MRHIQIAWRHQGTVLLELEYSYDDAGRIVRIIEREAGETEAISIFQYDARGLLDVSSPW
jgi:hypothetical protein